MCERFINGFKVLPWANGYVDHARLLTLKVNNGKGNHFKKNVIKMKPK
jgi:hypothetical protein